MIFDDPSYNITLKRLDMEDVPAKQLRKIFDKDLEPIESNGSGTIYDDLLTQLQIRPESCRLFFEQNLRPYRNKASVWKLIAKGNDSSLQKLSESFLTAFGKLVWSKDRGWLLRPDELQSGVEPLQYVPPKDRQEGDHELFYPILKQLWKRMRDTIHEVKKAYHDPNDDGTASHAGSARSPTETVSLASDTEAAPHSDIDTSTSDVLANTKSWKTRHSGQQRTYIRNRTHDGTLPRYDAAPPPPNEVRPPGFWPASRTQEAIMNIIVDLQNTRKNSHPKVFEAACEEHLARLLEWEEQDRLPEHSEETTTVTDGQTGDHLDRHVQRSTDRSTQTTSPTESEFTSNVVMNSATTTEATNSPSDVTESRSFTDAYRPYNLPRFPMSAYLPPVLPYTMSISITPFHVPPSSSNVQPFLWPLAPVQLESYASFIEGVRLRADVPDSVKSERLMIVLAYGWNDFCRVVRGEEDWRNGVMEDLNEASTRLGVRVWRARCCVFAV